MMDGESGGGGGGFPHIFLDVFVYVVLGVLPR